MSSHKPADPEQQKQEIAGLFSRAAPTYDRVGPRFFSHFGRRLVELAQIPSGARVLDVATGKGAVLFAAAEAVGPLGHVTGIDLADGMVRETTEEIRRLKLANAEVRQMDAENLQFPDASFDCVTCGFAIFFFPQLGRALSELSRVLKPDGRLALTSWDGSFDDERWKWFKKLLKEYRPPKEEENEPAVSPAPPEPDLLSEVGLKSVLEKIGFIDIKFVSETEDFIYKSSEEWWSALWSHGGRSSLEEIEEKHGPDVLDRFKAAVFEGLHKNRQADGIHDPSRAIFAVAVKPPDGK